MKKTLLIAAATCALLNLDTPTHAEPTNDARREAQVRVMCQNKQMRLMMIRELMSTKEGKMEMAQMLKHDAEFRSLYETQALNPG